MPRRAPLAVGPHEYSAGDARRTVEAIPDLWARHVWASSVSEGWMAGARGFAAEVASLAGVGLPVLDRVAPALDDITTAIVARWDSIDDDRIAAVIAAMWRFFPTMRALDVDHTGTIISLHASRGLPKQRVESADVGWTGLAGDVRRSRAHHGRPWQALCLWSAEVVDSLAAAGHPIAPGCAGENILVAGIPWGSMRPGAHFRIGAVRGVVTDYALPCGQIARWFTGGDPSVVHHEKGDLSRVYAMVQRTGTVSVGDTVEVFTDR